MKKLSLFALAAAGLFLGACSSDDAVKEVAQNAQDFTDGAFVGVSIQLPSAQTTTRANEDFLDGEAEEFAVKDGTLYIFEGANENDALFVGEYQIGTSFKLDGAEDPTDGSYNNNVTSTYNEATQISNELAEKITTSAPTTNYYAYVILNNNGVDVVCDNSTKFSDFKLREWNVIGSPVAEQANIGEGGLLMTNTPASAVKGGAAAAPITADNYSTLVKLDKTKIFATAAAAKAAPAACIFVERAAAKVTVKVADSFTGKVGTEATAPAIEFQEWQIINYPKTYYNTRQIDPAWGELASDAATTNFSLWAGVIGKNKYRFVSGTAFAPTLPEPHDGPFRTYFAKDPTYDDNFTLERPQALDGHWIALDKAGYTVENTFDVQHQTWGNTTQVTFKAKINNGTPFYTINGSDEMTTTPEADVTAKVSQLPAVKKALKDAVDNLVKADEDALTTPGTTGDFGYTASVSVTFKDGTPTASKDGVELKATYTITATGSDSHATDALTADKTAIEAALTAALNNFSVSYYAGGIAYYNARIQHFGEYETPWSMSEPFKTVVPGANVAQIYGYGQTMNGTDDEGVDNSAKRFLGRYGVVRDNWYRLTVDAVNHIGTAEPVDVSAEGNKNIPDDEIKNYIAVHVHIMPWVIRNQNITF